MILASPTRTSSCARWSFSISSIWEKPLPSPRAIARKAAAFINALITITQIHCSRICSRLSASTRMASQFWNGASVGCENFCRNTSTSSDVLVFFLWRDGNLVSNFDERKESKIEIFNFLTKNILLNRETTGYTNDSV